MKKDEIQSEVKSKNQGILKKAAKGTLLATTAFLFAFSLSLNPVLSQADEGLGSEDDVTLPEESTPTHVSETAPSETIKKDNKTGHQKKDLKKKVNKKKDSKKSQKKGA